MENRICVYAIAKNEEKHVDAWVDSVKEADHITVLDTGSTDGTIQRLRDRGVHVEQKIYDHFRFDQARNDSLKLIPEDCNICVVSDLDEYYSPGWADALREAWIDGTHERAVYGYTYRDDTAYVMRRNWIHSKNWSWKFPCHEVMIRNSDGEIWHYPYETLDISDKIILRHFPDQTKSRKLYLDLLRIRYKENPDDAFSHIYLIRELMLRKLWDEVLADEEHIEEKIKEYSASDACTLLTYLGDVHCEKNNLDKGVSFYYRAIRTYPGSRAPYLRLAQRLIDKKLCYLARDILLECLRDSVKTPKWTWLDSNDLWTWKVYGKLCEICYFAGDYDGAVKYAELGLEQDPDNEQLKQNLETSRRKAGKQWKC